MTPYNTEELIDKFYNELELKTGKVVKLSVDRPVIKCLNKKTFLSNFRTICKQLKRDESSILKFFSEELRTIISIDQNGGMVIDKLFKQNGIEKVLNSYIKEYVICSECKFGDTIIKKENRITFIECQKCFSKKPIQK